MSFGKLITTGALAFALFAAVPSKASADFLFTPFIGGTFGGSADVTNIDGSFEQKFNRKLTYGGSFAFLGGGIAGVEVDFGYSPNFFRDAGSGAINLVGDGNVTTLVGNFMLAGKGNVRPYVSVGGGLIRPEADSVSGFFQTDRNSFGFDAGGGVMAFFGGPVGIRGDIRYFRAVHDVENSTELDLSSFKFWRGTVGVVFRF
jgi:hypothetical protein